MLSRLASRFVQPVRPLAICVRTSADASNVRDEVNFPRPKPLEQPGKVRLGFIPDEWFLFFHKKTGVTGGYLFGSFFSLTLMSKEIWVLDNEYYVGLTMAIMAYFVHTRYGADIGKFLDKEIQKEADEYNSGKVEQKAALQQYIDDIKLEQWRCTGQDIINEAKKENVQLQLEAVYRERLMNVYKEVRRRLDYQVEKQNVDRRISQKHMVSWIVDNVIKSITPDQEKETLNKCIADLNLLASAK